MTIKTREKINKNNKKRNNGVCYEHCRIIIGGEDR
jgi:hypothetical protein